MKRLRKLLCFGLGMAFLLGAGTGATAQTGTGQGTITYNASIDYMALMIRTCENGSNAAMLEGTTLELQRNLKIKSLDMNYETTSFFSDYGTVGEITSAIVAYCADQDGSEIQIQPSSEIQYIVTASQLNVREGPGTEYGKIGAFDYGTVVAGLRTESNWYQVTDGATTGWCTASYLAVNDGSGSNATTTTSAPASYTDSDLYWLAVAITVEAGSSWLSDNHQLLVGNVVLNRVASSKFPNTVQDVIFQNGQYPWAARGTYPEPTQRALTNAQRLLDGTRACPDNVVFQSTATQGSGVYTSIYDATLGTTTYFCYQ